MDDDDSPSDVVRLTSGPGSALKGENKVEESKDRNGTGKGKEPVPSKPVNGHHDNIVSIKKVSFYA
jgi:hypothetical protein